jgi:hypothetical protein
VCERERMGNIRVAHDSSGQGGVLLVFVCFDVSQEPHREGAEEVERQREEVQAERGSDDRQEPSRGVAKGGLPLSDLSRHIAPSDIRADSLGVLERRVLDPERGKGERRERDSLVAGQSFHGELFAESLSLLSFLLLDPTRQLFNEMREEELHQQEQMLQHHHEDDPATDRDRGGGSVRQWGGRGGMDLSTARSRSRSWAGRRVAPQSRVVWRRDRGGRSW